MDGVENAINIINVMERFGVPLIVCGIIIFMVLKYGQKWLDVQLKIKEEQQKYYKERQTDYNKQMETQNRLIEQAATLHAISNEVIRANNTIIEGNTKALEAAATSNKSLVEAIEKSNSTSEKIINEMRELEIRIVEIDKDLIRISEKIV
jgi:recombinational DNA repair ATPase RecF